MIFYILRRYLEIKMDLLSEKTFISILAIVLI